MGIVFVGGGSWIMNLVRVKGLFVGKLVPGGLSVSVAWVLFSRWVSRSKPDGWRECCEFEVKDTSENTVFEWGKYHFVWASAF